MNDADGNSKEPAAHDWAGEAGTRWLAQLDRFESMIEPIGKALLDQAAYSASETVVDVGVQSALATVEVEPIAAQECVMVEIVERAVPPRRRGA